MSAYAWRGLYRAKTAVKRGFGFDGLLPNTDLVTLYDRQGMLWTHSNLGPHRTIKNV